MKLDVYEILNIKPDISLEQLEEIYKQKKLKYHPDQYPQATIEQQELLKQNWDKLESAYQEIKQNLMDTSTIFTEEENKTFLNIYSSKNLPQNEEDSTDDNTINNILKKLQINTNNLKTPQERKNKLINYINEYEEKLENTLKLDTNHLLNLNTISQNNNIQEYMLTLTLQQLKDIEEILTHKLLTKIKELTKNYTISILDTFNQNDIDILSLIKENNSKETILTKINQIYQILKSKIYKIENSILSKEQINIEDILKKLNQNLLTIDKETLEQILNTYEEEIPKQMQNWISEINETIENQYQNPKEILKSLKLEELKYKQLLETKNNLPRKILQYKKNYIMNKYDLFTQNILSKIQEIEEPINTIQNIEDSKRSITYAESMRDLAQNQATNLINSIEEEQKKIDKIRLTTKLNCNVKGNRKNINITKIKKKKEKIETKLTKHKKHFLRAKWNKKLEQYTELEEIFEKTLQNLIYPNQNNINQWQIALEKHNHNIKIQTEKINYYKSLLILTPEELPDLIEREKQMRQIRKEIISIKTKIQKITTENNTNIEQQIEELDTYNQKIDEYQKQIKEIYNISNIGKHTEKELQTT